MSRVKTLWIRRVRNRGWLSWCLRFFLRGSEHRLMDEPESIILIAYGKYLSIGHDFSYDYSIVMWPGVKPDPTRLQFHLKLKLLFFFIISRLRRGLRGFSSCLVTLSSETTLGVRRFDFVKKLKIWLPPATETTSACTHREAQVASSLFKTVNYKKGHLYHKVQKNTNFRKYW